MSDALTPHGADSAVDAASPPSLPKRRSLRTLADLPDRLSDALIRAQEALVRLVAFLLGTLLFPRQQARPAQLRPIARQIWEGVARFDDTQILADPAVVAPSIRAALRRRIHGFERELALVGYRFDHGLRRMRGVVALLAIAYLVLVLLGEDAIVRALQVPISSGGTIGFGFFFLHCLVLAFLFQLPSALMRERQERGVPAGIADTVAVFIPVLIGVPCFVAAYVVQLLPIQFLLLAIGQAGIVYTVFLVVFWVIAALRAGRVDAVRRREYPDALIAQTLLRAIRILEIDAIDLHTEVKVILIHLLDAAARVIQRDFPRQFRSSDMAMDFWVADSARQWAAALADLKKWVLTPKDDTRERLTRHLATQYVCFVAGTWDALERKQPEAIPRRRIGGAVIALVARTLVTAAVPILVLLFIQRSTFALTGAAATSATLVVVLFALVVFLSALDPDLESHVSTTKSVLTLVPNPLEFLKTGGNKEAVSRETPPRG